MTTPNNREVIDEFLDVIQVLVSEGYIDISNKKTIEFPLHYSDKFGEEEIEYLTDDNRAVNAMKRANIMTINDLIEQWDTLYKVRNCGKKSSQLIRVGLMARYYNDLSIDDRAKWLKEIIEYNSKPVVTAD